MSQCILVGNYGVGNLGDELLQTSIVTLFPEHQWTLVSATPGVHDIPRLPSGFRSLFCTPWWRTVRAMKHADAVVFGGGSLFTDVESSFAVVLWSLHVLVARLLRVPIILAFQGVGPLRGSFSRFCTRWVLAVSHAVSVRDEESLHLARALGRGDTVLSADPVFLQTYSTSISGTSIVIIPRLPMTAEFRAEVERAIRGHPDSSQYFVFLQPDHEKSLIEECKTWLPAAEIIGARSLKDLQKSLTDAALVITARYHGAVIAAAMGRSLVIVPQGRGDKLDALDHFLRTDGVATLRRRAEEGVHCLNSTLRTMRR